MADAQQLSQGMGGGGPRRLGTAGTGGRGGEWPGVPSPLRAPEFYPHATVRLFEGHEQEASPMRGHCQVSKARAGVTCHPVGGRRTPLQRIRAPTPGPVTGAHELILKQGAALGHQQAHIAPGS